MAEFSCEFCKAEFKKVSGLQRHIKTNKKCISKRETSVSQAELPSGEKENIQCVEHSSDGPTEVTSDVNIEVRNYHPMPLSPEDLSEDEIDETDLKSKYKQTLKTLKIKEKELDFFKEKIITMLKDEEQSDRRNGVKRKYYVKICCSCGILKAMEELKMKAILDETNNVLFKVDDNPYRYERDIHITMIKKDPTEVDTK